VFRIQVKPCHQIILALLLVVVQSQFLLHQLEFEAHDNESTCELCLQGNLLGHASVNTSLHVNFFSDRPDAAVSSYSLQHPGILRYAVPIPRAPPFSPV
jgi:hypothetical protein